MSITEIRSEIHRIVDQMDDQFLEVVHSMLGKYEEQRSQAVIGYDIDGTQRTASDLLGILESEVDKVRQGSYITIEELEKESAEWKSRFIK